MVARAPDVLSVLSVQHCAAWLPFASEHQNWLACHWHLVLFTDESRFTLNACDRCGKHLEMPWYRYTSSLLEDVFWLSQRSSCSSSHKGADTAAGLSTLSSSPRVVAYVLVCLLDCARIHSKPSWDNRSGCAIPEELVYLCNLYDLQVLSHVPSCNKNSSKKKNKRKIS